MRMTAVIVALAATAATTAYAQPGRLTDVQYLQAARCAGLASSEGLGAMDTASIDSLLKAEGRGRIGYISDKAQAARDEARRTANRAKAERKSSLMTERSGVCARYLG